MNKNKKLNFVYKKEVKSRDYTQDFLRQEIEEEKFVKTIKNVVSNNKISDDEYNILTSNYDTFEIAINFNFTFDEKIDLLYSLKSIKEELVKKYFRCFIYDLNYICDGKKIDDYYVLLYLKFKKFDSTNIENELYKKFLILNKNEFLIELYKFKIELYNEKEKRQDGKYDFDINFSLNHYCAPGLKRYKI